MSKTYHDRSAESHRPFLVTPYRADADGRLMPVMPEWCVKGEQRGGCRLRVDHFRERKTGPCFALAVLVCGVHQLGFTLYPPGHVPYGRVAIAPLDVDGEVVVELAGSAAAGAAWGLTVFSAALDAAGGVAWPRTNEPADPRRWWRTQGRYLERGARLLAVAEGVCQRRREQVARALGVALLVLVDRAVLWAASGYRGRGQAIVAVLGELEIGATLGDRLLTSGAAMGLWGAPSRWDPGGEAFRPTLRGLAPPAKS